MKMRYIVFVIISLLSLLFTSSHAITSSRSPIQPDDLEVINAASVKSINEFIARFNGEENHPQVALDSLAHRNTLATLFNWGTEENPSTLNKNIVSEFIDSVIINNVILDLDHSDIWSELLCEFELDGKRLDITLILSREKTNSGQSRWSIVAVKGFEKANLISDKLATFSPVDHELNFTSLEDWVNSNPHLITSLRAENSAINQLSFFMGLAYSGNLKFRYPRNQKIHVLNVPGFIFTISRVNRNSINTGWLIQSIEEAGEFNKLEYLNKLFIE